jgi:DNA-binding ferritin-like protein (Dps family)
MQSIKQKIKSNFEMSKQLSPENNVVFTDIVCYLRTSNLNNWRTEEIIEEILDIFLSAQARNEPLSQVIGPDYKTFCREVAANTSTQPLNLRILENFQIVVNGLGILFIIDLVLNYLPGMIKQQQLMLNYSLSLGTVLTTIGIIVLAFSIVHYIGQHSFELTDKSNLPASKIRRFLIGGTIGGIIFLFIIVTAKLRAYTLFTVPIYYPVLTIGVLYLVTFWLEGNLLKHSLSK